MFSDRHKGHNFGKLNEIFSRDAIELREGIAKFSDKVSLLNENIEDIEDTMEELRDIRDEKIKCVKATQDRIEGLLSDELDDKIGELTSKKSKIEAEYLESKALLDSLNQQIFGMSNVELVKVSSKLKDKISILNEKVVENFERDEELLKFSVDDLVPYTSSLFKMDPFSVREIFRIIFITKN